MANQTLEQLIRAANPQLDDELRRVVKALANYYGLTRNCLSCDHWRTNRNGPGVGGCELAEGNRPPDHVIVKGCKLWAEDDIPF